jgi:hypothetical protein
MFIGNFMMTDEENPNISRNITVIVFSCAETKS